MFQMAHFLFLLTSAKNLMRSETSHNWHFIIIFSLSAVCEVWMLQETVSHRLLSAAYKNLVVCRTDMNMMSDQCFNQKSPPYRLWGIFSIKPCDTRVVKNIFCAFHPILGNYTKDKKKLVIYCKVPIHFLTGKNRKTGRGALQPSVLLMPKTITYNKDNNHITSKAWIFLWLFCLLIDHWIK